MIALLTIEQVSEALQVPIDTIYRWRSTGYGPQAIKVGKYLRWRPEVVEEWILSQEPESNVTPMRRRAS